MHYRLAGDGENQSVRQMCALADEHPAGVFDYDSSLLFWKNAAIPNGMAAFLGYHAKFDTAAPRGAFWRGGVHSNKDLHLNSIFI